MFPEDITFTRIHPITRENYWRKSGADRTVRFADVEEVVWMVAPLPLGNGYVIKPVTHHLTHNGMKKFISEIPREATLHASSLNGARTVLADWCTEDNRVFLEMRHAWQCAEVDPEVLAAPYRIARYSDRRYLALRNDPRGYVWMLESVAGPPVPCGSAIIAEAERFARADGATFSGWIVSAGHQYSEPIPRKQDALKNLEWTAQEETAPRA